MTFASHDHVNLETDQLGSEGRESLGLSLGESHLDDQVLSLDVAVVAEALLEGIPTSGPDPELGWRKPHA